MPKTASIKKQSEQTLNFIKKAQEIHGDKFDYSKVEYLKYTLKVTIICKTCKDEIQQTPNAHLSGRGCANCAGIKRYTTETYIKAATQKFGNMFDYSKAVYISSRKPITIICNACKEEFVRKAGSHLEGNGCTHCEEGAMSKYRENHKQNMPD